MPAVAELQGASHWRIDCAGCVAIPAVPRELMPRAHGGFGLAEVRRRRRCTQCGERPGPESVTSWAQRIASGLGRNSALG
jgi:hypothetical protein